MSPPRVYRAGVPNAGTTDTPKPPSFDALLASINGVGRAAELTALLVTAQTYFMGTQREHLEAVVATRQADLADS